MEQINTWLETTYKNFVAKKGEIDKSDLDHVVDWMQSSDASKYLNRLNRISVPQAIDMSKKWTEAMNKKNAKDLSKKQDLGGVEVVYSFGDGYTMVLLKDEDSYKREGMIMGHCVASYFDDRHELAIYSLRGPNNEPHCTIEFEVKNKYVAQIKGKANTAVAKKYHKHVVDFLNQFNFDSMYSNDLKNIESIYFGNYIFLSDSMPESVTITKDLSLEQVNFKHTFKELVIKGNATFKHNHRCLKIAETLVITGDLIIEGYHDMVKLADKIKVGGDIEISECESLKSLSNTVEAKYISVYDSPKFSQKITNVELEVA